MSRGTLGLVSRNRRSSCRILSVGEHKPCAGSRLPIRRDLPEMMTAWRTHESVVRELEVPVSVQAHPDVLHVSQLFEHILAVLNYTFLVLRPPDKIFP